MRTKALQIGRVLLALGGALLGADASAEVAVSLQATGEVGTPGIVRSITDTPDPIDTVWDRFTPLSAGRHVLNENGGANQDGPPSMLVNPVSKHVLVAWARRSDTQYDVVLSVHDGTGWSAPAVLAGDPVESELDPHLALGPGGAVHLVYWVEGATRTVLHRQAPADLSTWSAPVSVSASGEDACRPSAVVHGGELLVAYEVHDYGFGGTPRQVVVSRSVEGGFEPQVVAITHNADEVWVRIHSHAGRLWVDWLDAAGEVAWTRQSTSGWQPVAIEPYGSLEDRDYFVRGRVRALATAP